MLASECTIATYKMQHERFNVVQNRRNERIEAKFEDWYCVRSIGRVVHWDINNERLHGTWFEESTGDPHLLEKMFRDVRTHDPNATLFLNDYNIVSDSRMTQVRAASAGFVTISCTEKALCYLTVQLSVTGLGSTVHASGGQWCRCGCYWRTESFGRIP